MGVTLRHVIFDIGGGIRDGREFKAVQLGGPSGGCVPASMLDTPVDYESLAATGAMVGSGGMVVVDDQTCMVDMARFFLALHSERVLRQVRALPARAPSACSTSSTASSPARDARATSSCSRRLSGYVIGRQPVRPRGHRAQPRAHHDQVLPQRVRGARRREALPGRDAARRSSATHRRGGVHRLHALRQEVPRRLHRQASGSCPTSSIRRLASSATPAVRCASSTRSACCPASYEPAAAGGGGVGRTMATLAAETTRHAGRVPAR